MMPLFSLSPLWLILLNAALWGFLQFGLARVMVALPLAWFHPGRWIFKTRKWEDMGQLWQRLFWVNRWKHRLPSGAKMTGGFSLSKLGRRDRDYLKQFMAETCRAEVTHFVALLFIPLFALFNPWWAMPIHLLYGLLSNLPCWLVQRVNRPKLHRLVLRVTRSNDSG